MNRIFFTIALLALSFSVWGQSDRVKTVEVPDSASMILFNSDGTGYDADDVQEAFEWLDFNSGEVFYISTTGNNSTGVKGYPNKTFTPTIQFDSVQNRTAFWYYPGIYNIGPSEEFQENFFGQYPFPYSLYAQNSVLNLIGGSGSRYVFRLNSSNQTDTVFNVSAKTIYLEDVAFLRTSEGKNAKIMADIKNLIINDKIFGGDAPLVIQQGVIKIDSLNSDYQILYSEPLDSSLLFFDIKKLYSNQIKDANKSRLFATASKGTAFHANTYVKINDLQISNTGPLWISNWNDKDLRQSTETFDISNALVIDTTNTLDTTFNVNAPGNASFGQTNSIEFIGLGENTIASRENIKTLKIGNLKTDKSISIRGVERRAIYKIDIKSAQMSKRRLINISNGFSTDTCQVKISCESCISEYSTPISNFNTDATTTIEISGTYQVKKTGMPVIYSASTSFILENAQLINDGVTPAIIANSPITVYVRGNLYMNSDSIHPNVTFQKTDYGYTNPTNTLYQSTQTILDSLFEAIPKQSATLYQSTLRQYTFPTLATVDTIIIDTLSNAMMTDSITQDTGYIRNISSDTMRWQVSYNFFRDSDEDALTSFMDLTTAGTDSPEAIPGSEAYSEQAVANGTQHAGQTFTVDVPPGDAIRLCVYGSAPAAGVDISDLTISVQEIYRE